MTKTDSSLSTIKLGAAWQDCSADFNDIYFYKADGIAKITINRPEVRNAFRPQTVQEMIQADRKSVV